MKGGYNPKVIEIWRSLYRRKWAANRAAQLRRDLKAKKLL